MPIVKIQKIIFVSTFIFFAHSVEEYLTNFPNIDWSVLSFAKLLNITPLLTWLIIQIVLFAFLIFSQLFILKKSVPWWFALIFTGIMLIELSHIYFTITRRLYYPGFYTSLAFPILGFYFFQTYRNYCKTKIDFH